MIYWFLVKYFRGIFMKHQVCALLLCVSFLGYLNGNQYIVVDKLQRIGRFNYEDSFDENLIEEVLKHSPVAVKKNIKNLLYSSNEDELPRRLLLLGGVNNASTTAIAKSIALRCGYDYYVIEASILLKKYYEGRQMLLDEVLPIIKKGKPLALIITELPEIADFSGVLASTLWSLIDQCEQYPDVLVIGTSAFSTGQLSESIKERFGENLIPVALDAFMQNQIEEIISPQISWIEKYQGPCMIAVGFLCCILTAHVGAQMLFAIAQAEREQEMLRLGREKRDIQKKQYNLQVNQHIIQLQDYLTQIYQLTIKSQESRYRRNQYSQYDKYTQYLQQLPEDVRQLSIAMDQNNEKVAENITTMIDNAQKEYLNGN
jgi:hypothetical protein